MHVVIAEDSPTQAELLKFTLENLGFVVHCGDNGQIALDLARRIRPGLIISDVVMPEMDGYELVRNIRNDPDLGSIPVILLTSLSELEDILKGLEIGADSYIMKPFNEQYLHSRIKQVLENRMLIASQREDEVIEFCHGDQQFRIRSGASIILNLLFSTYESALYRNMELEAREKELMELNEVLRKKVEHRKSELNHKLQQITEAQENLKSSEEKFRELVDHALAGIFIWSEDGRMVLGNKSYRAIGGFSPEEDISAREVQALFSNREDHEKLMGILRKEGSVSEFETVILDRSGEEHRVLISAGADGPLISGMMLDISERKQAEERLKAYEKELIRAREKAESSEKLKTAFLANMSNEILNPLNALVGFTELMGKEKTPASKLKNFADKINQSGNLLINIIENIIDIARVETGELQIRKSACNINKLVLDLYSTHEAKLIEEKKTGVEIILKREIKEAEFSMMTEPFRLKRILMNLLGNAIKYTESGIIEFGYALHEDEEPCRQTQIQFYVKDTGKGIPQQKLQLLFDRFRYTDTSYIKLSEGAGLGLPLTKAYVELLGGKIWCKSEQGKGSEFYFTLPFEDAAGVERQSRPAEPFKPPGHKKQLNILIAEDMESNYILLEALLKGSGSTLIWAKNGKEAVDHFKRHRDIDLILMDLRMPVMSGYEAVEEIRKLDRRVPIIVQTAFAREEDREAILNLGCNSFLTKPITRKSLLGEISRISGSGSAS
jgi:PAS domain S-box-containing protein